MLQSWQKMRRFVYLTLAVVVLGLAVMGFAGQQSLANPPTPRSQQTIPTDTPTPTHTPTHTPTATPSSTPTSTPTATSTPVPGALTITSITPAEGLADVPNEVSIVGSGFADGARARLVHDTLEYTLTTTFLDPNHLRGSVPAGLVAGLYDLGVRNPDGGQAALPDAYTVYPPGNDDLMGHAHEFWTAPAALRAGTPGGLGLVVHRRGGKDPLMDVGVAFYQGDPDAAGVLLGEGTISLLSPRSSASTSSVDWTPRQAGVYTLYARIDPQDRVPESLETNNTLSRTLTVLETALDRTPPVLDLLTIDDGAQTTFQPDVTLALQATDPAPGGGVRSVFLREFLYSQGAERWIPVQESGWLDYSAFAGGYAWSLLPLPGVKVVQAWAADVAGNVSTPLRAAINYVLETDFVDQGQVRLYRYTLKPGDRLAVQVQPLHGDPDLYIWPPDLDSRPPWVSDGAGAATDAVTVTAPVGGIYQVEVVGYTPATYRFGVELTPGGTRNLPGRSSGILDAAQTWGRGAASKVPREQPLLPPDAGPDERQGVPAPPAVSDHPLYLPVIRSRR